MSVSKAPSGRWRARYRDPADPGGPQRTRTFDRKSDAEAWVRKQLEDLRRDDWIDPAHARVTFKEFAEAWRLGQPHRAGTTAGCETYLRLHAYPAFGARPLASIRPSRVQAWVTDRSKVLAPASVEQAFRWVAAVFRAAVRDRVIARSPCDGIKLPRKSVAPLQPLEHEQIIRLAGAAAPRYRALLLFMAGSGLRISEALGTTVDRVDFLRRLVTVDRQLARGKGVELVDLKTEASSRVVPLAAGVCDELARHLSEHGPGPEGLLWSTPSGAPLKRTAAWQAWNLAKLAAELPAWATPHDLRHFFASVLIHEGVSVKGVQAALGHRSAVETLDTYGHWFPSADDQIRAAIEGLFRNVEADLRHADG